MYEITLLHFEWESAVIAILVMSKRACAIFLGWSVSDEDDH